MKRLAAQVKLSAVLEVIEGKRGLVTVSAKFGCSRQSLASWVRRFRQARSTFPKAGEAKCALKVFQGAYKRGASHPRSLAPHVERLVLEMVIKKPELNVRGLALELGKHGFGISVSAVYKILVRHNLQVQELRHAFSFSHPAGTIYASRISPEYRKKLIEEYLIGRRRVSEICRRWSISRRTFYLWLARYQEATIDPLRSEASNSPFDAQGKQLTIDKNSAIENALARRYRRGAEHQRSIGVQAREAILDMVRQNPYYSVHKIYEMVKRIGNLAFIGHQAIQNLLSRENLNTLARRLEYAAGFVAEPFVEVAPLYHPEIPVYRWRQLFAPFVTVPKLLFTDPRRGIPALFALSMPFSAVLFFIRTVSSASAGIFVVSLALASVALFFGFFFFVYSMKYYLSIFMVLRVAQSGGRGGGVNSE